MAFLTGDSLPSPCKVTFPPSGRSLATLAPGVPPRRMNDALEEGDIIYVPRSTLAHSGYVLGKLSPALTVIGLGHTMVTTNN